jgi:DNA-binding response OmpR family regulator
MARTRYKLNDLREFVIRYLTKPIKLNELLEALDVALIFAKTRAARANKEVIE